MSMSTVSTQILVSKHHSLLNNYIFGKLTDFNFKLSIVHGAFFFLFLHEKTGKLRPKGFHQRGCRNNHVGVQFEYENNTDKIIGV